MVTTQASPVQESRALRRDRRSLNGWGGRPSSTADVVTPRSTAEIENLWIDAAGVIPRGLGRSYGDAGQLAGGMVIDMTHLTGVELDQAAGVVTALAGTSVGQILEVTVPRGWFLPVTPGTRHVTIGGAIAADVHGKNHHRDGSFGQHLESIDLLTSSGDVLTVGPGSDAFAATVGGMGLTGTIIKATFRLIPIETPWMSVDTFRSDDIEAVMADLIEADSRYRYSVAWVDVSRHGSGRGIVMGGDHCRSEQSPPAPERKVRGSGVTVPGWMPGVVNDLTVAMFNRLWFKRAPRRETGRATGFDAFFYPLDVAGNWTRLYGPAGFLQYQFVVPQGEEATLHAITEQLARADTPVSLAVLKRMGPSKGQLLSFPMHGWTLALDMPLGDIDLAELLDKCDEQIAKVGGRVYLAKDARLRPQIFREMYPGLPRWREIQGKLDPGRNLRSDLSRRLQLVS